jgi:hypothetical protein
MTRRSQNRVLALVIIGLLLLIGGALAARVTGGRWLAFYEVIRDTSLLLVTVVAAFMAHIYQKRSTFLQSLREQWREIVQAKSALIYYCHQENPSLDDYLKTARQLSECIDNMRIVYANVGETDELIGYFPYAPLHQMRKVLEGLDPRISMPTPEARYAARGQIWDAFNAIREHFLDEFDIEEPSRPILIHAMKREKKDGAANYAKHLYEEQRRRCGG